MPLLWSAELCQRLQELGKEVECFTYKNQPHTFREDGGNLFMQRVVEFYRKWLN